MIETTAAPAESPTTDDTQSHRPSDTQSHRASDPRGEAIRAALAGELEERIGEDRIEWSMHIPRLIRLWQQSDTPERALRWLVRAINVYDHDGLYEVEQQLAEFDGGLVAA